MVREDAEALGAQMEFGQKYPDMVNVYFVGDPENAFSKEFCGGPHVDNTSELGKFKIKKKNQAQKEFVVLKQFCNRKAPNSGLFL